MNDVHDPYLHDLRDWSGLEDETALEVDLPPDTPILHFLLDVSAGVLLGVMVLMSLLTALL